MRAALLFVAGCGFHGRAVTGDAVTGDAALADAADAARDDSAALDAARDDGPVAVAHCPADPTLPLCFTFDENPLPGDVPNEGSVAISARLTGATSTPSPEQNAALIGAASEIFIPATTAVPTILTLEMWLRLDQDPAAGHRMGMTDDAIPPATALFYYHDTAPPQTDAQVAPEHYVRCALGGALVYGPDVALALGAWTYVACTCDLATTTATLYINGASVATAGSCSAGGIATDGLTLGQDNVDGVNIGDPWIGAIDGFRAWTVTRSAAQIAATTW